MTDAPKAMSLPASDWRSLTLANLVELHTFLTGIQPLAADQARMALDQIDKIKLLATQWHAMSVQSQVATAEPHVQTDDLGRITNGATQSVVEGNTVSKLGAATPAKRKYTRRVRAAPAPAVA